MEIFQKYLTKKMIESECSHEKRVDCTVCEVGRGCCKRRHLMLAMVKNILQWLNENKSQLQDIDFAHDVILIENRESFLGEIGESDKETITSSSKSLDSGSHDSTSDASSRDDRDDFDKLE